MPRKKSGKKAAEVFESRIDRIDQYLAEVDASGISDQGKSWAYEAAIIKTAVAFEHLMLDCLVTAINNDTGTLSQVSGVSFPKHLTDEVCEYLVTGGQFFDFKALDGLIKKVKSFVDDSHWLVVVIKKPKYKSTLDCLIALRNFAAHESAVGKRTALKCTGSAKMSSAGAWAKTQGRMADLITSLRSLAGDIDSAAPY
jgi:hypothetical protein